MKINMAVTALVGSFLMVTTVLADHIVVVPGGFSSTEANSSDNAPLGATEQHFQQVFSSTLLTNLSIGDLIDGIAFRVEGNESALPAQIVTTYDIGLGQSLVAPGGMSSTFAANRGADFTMVRSGPLTIADGTFTGGQTPNDFGWISFATPYEYLGGNLLVEIAYEGFSEGRDADAAYPYDASLAQTAFGTGYNATTADAGLYPEALVMGFSVETVTPVPEPSASLVFAGGLLMLVVCLRGKSRAA
ncbi:MAG TPA: hypothetical protein VH255_09185 [Verrucomicrobiae bacterium]|jgi:hypothetical protein|nr:hypothetical protein [Verrucomicrobiae bacterium]